MLYYYKVKRKRKYWTGKTLAVALVSVIVYAYLYPGAIADVVSKLGRHELPLLPPSISPADNQADPETAMDQPGGDSLNINVIKASQRDLESQGKTKEATELQYSCDLLAKVDDKSTIAKTRVRAIRRDIAATMSYFKTGNVASNKTKILGDYDSGNLAFVYYPNYGVHFNPVTTANMAHDQFAKGNYKRVVKIADELLNNVTVKQYPSVGQYYVWEYYFDLDFGDQKYPAPWVSGMAQGLILDVLGKAYTITGDQRYLRAGKMVLNSFKVPWNDGGVTDTDNHGNWYLEIAATNKIRILNGFLFALDSLYDYYKLTGDNEAKRLFVSGVGEARAHLKDYDLGYWSHYSLLKGDKAGYGYHKLHIELLDKLYQITGYPEFKQYADRFNFYLKNRFIDIPPDHRSFKAISALAESGVIVSKDGWFGPQTQISKGEFVVWLARFQGWSPLSEYNGYYGDVKRGYEDWGYVEAAFKNGLRLSDKDGLFHPYRSMSRYEATAILYKLFDRPPDPPSAPNTSTETPSLENADSMFYVTREQVANTLYKLLELRPKNKPGG